VPPERTANSGGARGKNRDPGPQKARRKAPGDAAADYRAKGAREAETISRRLATELQAPPFGEPASGVMLVVDGPAGPRAGQAVEASLAAVGLPTAYVTWTATGLLMEQILSSEPGVLAAVGPEAAREIDALDHPLARNRFADAPEGEWFAWTKGTAGLRLPSVHPALADEAEKRRFWSCFLRLRELANGSP
jgi:hypothetical protein